MALAGSVVSLHAANGNGAPSGGGVASATRADSTSATRADSTSATRAEARTVRIGLRGATGSVRTGARAAPRTVHPVTLWRGRLAVALDALQCASDTDVPVIERRKPMETTNVLLPTGDRLQIPTGAETLRLKSYLVISRNTTRDFTEFADMCDSMDTQTAAEVLARIDRYYSGQRSRRQWVATQLIRRLADPHPSDSPDESASDPAPEADWERVRQRCLAVAVAMLEEAR
jgi:RND superfamily putative drug exporter